jgi:hypothetical protein
MGGFLIFLLFRRIALRAEMLPSKKNLLLLVDFAKYMPRIPAQPLP